MGRTCTGFEALRKRISEVSKSWRVEEVFHPPQGDLDYLTSSPSWLSL